MPFICSICEEESTRICVRCTKDTCSNHLCEKCGACSDCCDCEIRLDAEVEEPQNSVRESVHEEVPELESPVLPEPASADPIT